MTKRIISFAHSSSLSVNLPSLKQLILWKKATASVSYQLAIPSLPLPNPSFPPSPSPRHILPALPKGFLTRHIERSATKCCRVHANYCTYHILYLGSWECGLGNVICLGSFVFLLSNYWHAHQLVDIYMVRMGSTYWEVIQAINWSSTSWREGKHILYRNLSNHVF